MNYLDELSVRLELSSLFFSQVRTIFCVTKRQEKVVLVRKKAFCALVAQNHVLGPSTRKPHFAH